MANGNDSDDETAKNETYKAPTILLNSQAVVIEATTTDAGEDDERDRLRQELKEVRASLEKAEGAVEIQELKKALPPGDAAVEQLLLENRELRKQLQEARKSTTLLEEERNAVAEENELLLKENEELEQDLVVLEGGEPNRQNLVPGSGEDKSVLGWLF